MCIYVDIFLLKNAGKRICFFCSSFVHLGLHINLSQSELHLAQHCCFLGLFSDTMDMSVFLKADKILEIPQLALSLMQMQPVTVCEVMSFLGMTNFNVSGHQQLYHLCHVRAACLLFIIHFLTYFVLDTILFKLCVNFRDYLSCNNVQFPCSFVFPMWLSLSMLPPVARAFIGSSGEGPYYLYELSIFLSEGCLGGGSWQGLGVLENAVLIRNFQMQLHGQEIQGKNCIFKDNIGVRYSNHSAQRNDPLLYWNLSNLTTWGGDMGQNCFFFFQDNTGVGVLKTFI